MKENEGRSQGESDCFSSPAPEEVTPHSRAREA